MRTSSIVGGLNWIVSGLYNLFFSSDPDYQPLSAKPWHEAALTPDFWLATLQMRLDELMVGLQDGSIAGQQLQEFCENLSGLVTSNTVKPSEFVYEIERLITASGGAKFPTELASMLDRLVTDLQANQAWALSCLQAELASLHTIDQHLLGVIDFYRQVIDVRLFKPIAERITKDAEPSLKPQLKSLLKQAAFCATPESFFAFKQWQRAQMSSGVDQDEKYDSFPGLARYLMSAIGRATSFLSKKPFLALTSLLLAQSRLAFGSEVVSNSSSVSSGFTGDTNAGLPFKILYGVPDVSVYSDPLSQGHKTIIPMNVFYIPANPEYHLSLVGGGTLPSWITFQPSSGQILSHVFIENMSDLLPNDFGQDVEVGNDIAYLAGGVKGLYLIDVSDKSSPQLASQLCDADECDVRQIALDSTHAYLANGCNGYAIVEISNSSHPYFIKKQPMSGHIVTGLELFDNTLYLTADGIFIVNVTDPRHPLPLGNITTGQFSDIEIEGSIAYLADATFGAIQTYEISDPSSPEFLDHYLFLHAEIRDIEVHNKIVFVATKNDGLQIIDATLPSNLSFIGAYAYNQSLPSPVIDIELSNDGNFAYITGVGTGVVKVNTTNPARPYDVAVLPLPASQALDVHPDLIAVTDPVHYGVWLLRNDFTLGEIRTWPVPDQRGRVNLDLVLTASLGASSISSHFTLSVADRKPNFVSKLPALKAGIDSEGSAYSFGVAVVDLDDDSVSLSVTSLSETLTSQIQVLENKGLIEGSKLFFNQSTCGMALNEDVGYLHVALGEAGLTLLSLDDVSNPTKLTNWQPFDDEILHVGFASDKELILASGLNGVYVLTFSQPQLQYQWHDTLDVVGQSRFTANSKSNIVYVVSETNGFYVYGLNQPRDMIYSNVTLTGYDIRAQDGIVYIAGGGERSMWVVDMSDHNAPSSLSIPLRGETNAAALTLGADFAVVVGKTIQVFDLHNFSKFLSAYRLRYPGVSVELVTDSSEKKLLACVSQGSHGLEILDVSSPGQGIVPVYQYTSGNDNFNIQQIIFTANATKYGTYTTLMSTGRLGVQVIAPKYGWYYSHMVMMNLTSGDQGLHQIQLAARSRGVETTADLQLNVNNKRPVLTEDFSENKTISVTVGYKWKHSINVSLSEWVSDPDGDELYFSLTRSSGVLVASNSREAFNRCTIINTCESPCLSSTFLACTGRFTEVGEYSFMLYASDQYGGEVSGQVKIKVDTPWWNKLWGWIAKKAEGYGTIAGLAVIAFLLILYYKVKRHVGNNMAEIIRAQLKLLYDNTPQQECEVRLAPLASDDIIEAIIGLQVQLLNKPLSSIGNYQLKLDELCSLCCRYILIQKEISQADGQVMRIVSLWPVFQRQQVFPKIIKLLSYHFRNAVFDEWSYLHSRALLDLVRYTVLSVFATEDLQKPINMHGISVAERKNFVGQLLELASFGIGGNANPVVDFFAVKAYYNVLMALDWARCLKTMSVGAFGKQLVAQVCSVDISGILGTFVMVHTHSASASFTRSMRFLHEVAGSSIEEMVMRRIMLLNDDRATYDFVSKQNCWGRFGQNITWLGILLGRASQRFLSRMSGKGYSAYGGWLYHLASIEKMLAAYEKTPTDKSKQQLETVLSQYADLKNGLYQRQLIFSQCAAARLKPDPRNQYLPVYAKYLLDHLNVPQAQPDLSLQAGAGAGQGAGGGGSGGTRPLRRQISDPLIAKTILLPGVTSPVRPKLRPLGKNCWDTTFSFLCCSRANGPTSHPSGHKTRVPSPKSPPIRPSDGYVRLEESGSEVEMKAPAV